MSSILVTGGAGYIGSEVVRQLISQNHSVVVVDDLSTGDARRLAPEVTFFQYQIGDHSRIEEIFQKHEIEIIFHFAAFKQARESNNDPSKYWLNNVSHLISLLNTASKFNVKQFILSSSCSVYGNSGKVDEQSELKPVSVYGWTKLVSEQLVQDYSRINSWKFVNLRYFNVVGASESPYAGDFSSHCILPTLFRKVAAKQAFTQLGDDFNTPDKTAIRDYIDVRDVASAHIASINLLKQGYSGSLNISTGRGISVKELLQVARNFIPDEIFVEVGPRNLSDPAEIWGNPSRAILDSGWKPRFTFEESVKSHWESFSRFSEFSYD